MKLYTYDENQICEYTITNNSKIKALTMALYDENMEAIEEFLYDDEKEWIFFTKVFINEVDYENLTDFQMELLPKLVVTDLSELDLDAYSFYVKYVKYKHMTDRDYFYLLSNNKEVLKEKLSILEPYTHESVLKYLDEMNSIPCNNYYIKNGSKYFRDHQYKDGRIVTNLIYVGPDKLEHCTLDYTFDNIIAKGISFKIISDFLGTDNYRWDIITKVLLVIKISDSYYEANKEYILSVINNERFVVKSDMKIIPKYLLDDIKLRVDPKFFYIFVQSDTNPDVFHYLLYNFLHITLGTYQDKLHYYTTNMDRTKKKVNTQPLIEKILAEEGIPTNKYLYNILNLLYSDVFVLERKLTVTTLGEYYQRVKKVKHSAHQHKLLRNLLEI